MKAEDYAERAVEVEGWPVHLTTWRLGAVWHCRADNVSPGATLARIHGHSKQDVEQRAVERARDLLGRTRRRAV